jgi:hypothetical protein
MCALGASAQITGVGWALLLRQGMRAWCVALSDVPDHDWPSTGEAPRRNCPTRLGGEVIQIMATMTLSVLQEVSHVR